MGTSKTKPFYRNAEDTLEDVGITQRQLGYWRKQGLFAPELGATTKFFTEHDTRHLNFLKRLIVDLGLPVATVQKLISSAEAEEKDDFFSVGVEAKTFIDPENLRLVFPPDAMSELVADAMAGAKPWRLEQLLEPTILIALRTAWVRSPNPDVYEAHIKVLHDRIERIELLSRFHTDSDDKPYFWPPRSTDPELSDELIERLTADKERLEKRLESARSRKYWR